MDPKDVCDGASVGRKDFLVNMLLESGRETHLRSGRNSLLISTSPLRLRMNKAEIILGRSRKVPRLPAGAQGGDTPPGVLPPNPAYEK